MARVKPNTIEYTVCVLCVCAYRIKMLHLTLSGCKFVCSSITYYWIYATEPYLDLSIVFKKKLFRLNFTAFFTFHWIFIRTSISCSKNFCHHSVCVHSYLHIITIFMCTNDETCCFITFCTPIYINEEISLKIYAQHDKHQAYTTHTKAKKNWCKIYESPNVYGCNESKRVCVCVCVAMLWCAVLNSYNI